MAKAKQEVDEMYRNMSPEGQMRQGRIRHIYGIHPETTRKAHKIVDSAERHLRKTLMWHLNPPLDPGDRPNRVWGHRQYAPRTHRPHGGHGIPEERQGIINGYSAMQYRAECTV